MSLNANERYLYEGNILDELDRMRREQARAARRDINLTQLGEVVPDLGEINQGMLTATTAIDPTDVTSNGAFFSADGIGFSDGHTYNVGGVENGRLMFGLRAEDGAGVFAGGQGVIDQEGINLNGIRYGLRHFATGSDGTSDPRYGVFEMFYPDGTDVPALRLSFYSSPTGTELAVDGDFETDAGAWTGGGGGAIDTSNPHGGLKCFTLSSGNGGAKNATVTETMESAAFIAVNPSTHYAVSAYLYGGAGVRISLTDPALIPYTWSVTRVSLVRVDWYTSGDVFISSSTCTNTGSLSSGYSQYPAVVVSPSNAAKAKIYASNSAVFVTNKTGVYLYAQMYIDDVSMTELAVSQSIVLADGGVMVNGAPAGSLPRAFKAFFDQKTGGPAMTLGVDTDQAANARWTTDSAADGDEYTFEPEMDAGTWTITLLGVKNTLVGKTDIYLDGVKINGATPFDWYNASKVANTAQTIAGVTVATGGRHTLVVKVNGKHASSSGYKLYSTWVTGVRTGA